jgi:curved DNA-binding protein CbpA
VAKTLYDILGLPCNATPEAIKDAYVKQAARLRSTGATAQAEVVKQAYEVLSDARLRARYDQQAYKVAEGPAFADAAERHWLLSWRGALLGFVVVAVLFYSWSYHAREQTRIRLEHERIEAQRLVDEMRRDEEQRRSDAERRLADERRREAANIAAAQHATQASRNETLYRDSLQQQRNLQSDRLQAQAERADAQRAELERRRLDLQNARDLERDKRQVRELERTSPRRF